MKFLSHGITRVRDHHHCLSYSYPRPRGFFLFPPPPSSSHQPSRPTHSLASVITKPRQTHRHHHKILQAHSVLQQSFVSTVSSSSCLSSLGGYFGGLAGVRNVSTAADTPSLPPAMQKDISSVLDFWFSQPPMNWFAHPDSEAFDSAILERFGGLCRRARSGDLQGWSETPPGALALIILLDQFPRNVYRGTPDAHASDPLALALATRSIARGFDREVDPLRAIFFYLPLEHDETLVSQIASVACYEALRSRCTESDSPVEFLERSVAFAKSHRDVIARFGRFPSRNKILGRESTDEERRFLEENPSGFY